jgi:hypothetical protein
VLSLFPPAPTFRHAVRKAFAAAVVHAPSGVQRAGVQSLALLVDVRQQVLVALSFRRGQFIVILHLV